jgi:hypothetical protein
MIIKIFFTVKEKVQTLFVKLCDFVKALHHKWIK